jgi:AcrR family transcriptional regulator
MDAIARKAGMAKGTVFLYFKTKEDLFFSLTAQEFESMFVALNEKLSELVQRGTRHGKAEVMRLLQEVLAPRKLLTRLISIQHIILEQNIRYEEARTFKLMLTRHVQTTGHWFDQAIPFFQPGQGARFVMWMYAFVIGFSHVAEPAPVIQKVYQKEPEVMKLKVDFGQEFFAALNTVWEGWKAENKAVKRPGRQT